MPPRKIDFKTPPVVETTWGIFFAPLAGWTTLEAGIFWDRVRADYPDAHLVNPVGNIDFAEFPTVASDEITLETFPTRCKMTSGNRNQLLQVQSNSFRRSWRVTDTAPTYQHYDETEPLFYRDWSRFIDFLKDRNIGPPSVWQCEVTYINHFEKGREWKAFPDIRDIFKGDVLPMIASGGSRNLASFSFTHVTGSDRREIDCQLAARRKDGKEVLQLRISSLNTPESNTETGIRAAISAGHIDVIETFVAITTEKVQQLWGKL